MYLVRLCRELYLTVLFWFRLRCTGILWRSLGLAACASHTTANLFSALASLSNFYLPKSSILTSGIRKRYLKMATNTGTAHEIDLRKCASVGQGILTSMADDVRKQIELMPATPFYQQKEGPEYPFEALDSNAIVGVVKPAVDAWFNVRGTQLCIAVIVVFLLY
jgi:hypothetical protein